jgi:septation ring formation regulator EzrA
MNRTAITILATLLVIFGIYRYGFSSGWDKREAEMQAEIARLNEESRAKEQKLAQDLNNTSSQLREANDVVTKKQTDLDAAIRAGRVRLNSSSCVQAASNSTSPARDSQEAGSKPNGQANSSIDEQERQTLAAIAEIIAQGDRNTAQLNACIDAYQKIRETINGG